MNKIDYSKWYGSKLCPFCVKKLEKDDLGIKEVEISGYRGSRTKVKSSFCKECGTDIILFKSPARFVLSFFIISIMMIVLFFFIKLGAQNTSTMAVSVSAGVFVLATCAIFAILLFLRNRGKDVIKQLESTN